MKTLWEQWLLADPEEAHRSDQGAEACEDQQRELELFSLEKRRLIEGLTNNLAVHQEGL